MNLPKRVTICEQGPRDGIQTLPDLIPTGKKIELIDALSDTGLPMIEATSFVSPRSIPQLRDAPEVMAGIKRRPGTRYTTIVPNELGAQRAAQAGVHEMGFFLSASESHNQHNVRMSVEDSLKQVGGVLRVAREAGIPVFAGVVAAFGCPFEGDVPMERVARPLEEMLNRGCHRAMLGDTTGMANPRQVQELMCFLQERLPGVPIGLHFHDNRGTALANIFAAVQVGITHFDSCVGGLGGSPTPGAMGNVCSEDLVHMLHEMGIETGIDLDKLMDCSRLIGEITGKELQSHLLKSGKRSQLVQR